MSKIELPENSKIHIEWVVLGILEGEGIVFNPFAE